MALDNRAAAAESVIDWLRTQAVADIAPGFVGIPQVEWDAVFAANKRLCKEFIPCPGVEIVKDGDKQ